MMTVNIGNDWDEILKNQWNMPYYKELRQLLIREYSNYTVYPPMDQIFNALKHVPFDKCKVVIIGQDPYHEPRQANGLSFSVEKDVQIPPSLRNIYKELESDIGFEIPNHGDLTKWAEQGVLLLNATLTVRAHQANSHSKIGWTILTDYIIQKLGEREHPLAFLLWGKFAQSKKEFIKNNRDLIICSAHPSPLSAHRGFFGSKPFSKINAFLIENGDEPIDWQI